MSTVDRIRGSLRIGGLLLAVGLAAGPTAAADRGALFREQVGPLIEAHCVRCHNRDAAQGDLSFTDADSVRASGVITPGRPDASLLIAQVTPEGGPPEMPKEGKPLNAAERQLLRQWIAQGAYWPAGEQLHRPPRPDTPWWSLTRLERPAIPPIRAADAETVRTPVDAMIVARLREKSLSLAPEADRRTLIRRLYYDLIGLAPAPAEMDDFIADSHPLAYQRLVDRLLASPRFGERWARHWLDLVHYGDTHGYDKDKPREHAWPYRDYVIGALNHDKSFDRFLKEQIAGDVLYPGTSDGVIATGFLAAGPFDWVGHIEVPESKTDGQITRNLDRDDMVTTVMNTFVSLTVQCARCHDHKFDPISQEDYYCLQAVFAAVDRADRPYPIDDAVARRSTDPPLVFAATAHFTRQGNFIPTGGTPRPIHVLDRGNVTAPRQLVGPGTVTCVADLPARFDLGAASSEGDRRAALANWMSDSRNPLTWRSIVNRLWQHHFGRGLVDTPNDFGRMGSRPTHPRLLDWLAVELRDSRKTDGQGQSLKRIHRLLVTSAVYRQASVARESGKAVDASNRLLWRMRRRRLDAESLRDTVLALAGELDLTMGGPGYRLFVVEHPEHSPHYLYQRYNIDDPASHRRSIYRFIVRSVPDPLMETFDCADPSQLVAAREETLTATQALALMNHPLTLRMAEHFAARIAKSGAASLGDQVRMGWREATGRAADARELALLTRYAGTYGLAATCRVILNTNEFAFVD